MTACATAALIAGIEQAQAESGGLMSLFVVQPHEAADLFVAALAGNATAYRLVRILTENIRRVRTAPKRAPILCATCQHTLRSTPHSFVVAEPMGNDPTQTVCLGICVKCAVPVDAVLEKAMGAFREIWPELRPVNVTHPNGGRA